jgi:hypothetical protein
MNETNGLAEKLRGMVARMTQGQMIPFAEVAPVMSSTADTIDALEQRIQYLEESLTAAVTGELPKKHTLNQFLLAQRAKNYLTYLSTTTDSRDKLVGQP